MPSDVHGYPRQPPAACTPPHDPTSRACPYFPFAAEQVTACASPVASERVKTHKSCETQTGKLADANGLHLVTAATQVLASKEPSDWLARPGPGREEPRGDLLRGVEEARGPAAVIPRPCDLGARPRVPGIPLRAGFEFPASGRLAQQKTCCWAGGSQSGKMARGEAGGEARPAGRARALGRTSPPRFPESAFPHLS